MKKKSDYYEKLKDPRWQKKRLEIMERAVFECENCGTSDKPLNIHHQYYNFILSPWEYPDDSLSCLCEDCHKAIETQKKELKDLFDHVSCTDYDQLLGYLMMLNARISANNKGINTTIYVNSYEQIVGVCDYLRYRDETGMNRIFEEHEYKIKFLDFDTINHGD